MKEKLFTKIREMTALTERFEIDRIYRIIYLCSHIIVPLTKIMRITFKFTQTSNQYKKVIELMNWLVLFTFLSQSDFA